MQANNFFYKHTYMNSFDALVIDCTPKNGYFEIILENTCFYPEGGGQPSDTGHIGESDIIRVIEKDGVIIHTGTKPLLKGESYAAQINWDKRFEHMQHHSAEHIVSGIIHKLYGADNVGFHIGQDYVTMDYNVELKNAHIEKIEYLSNEAVFKNIPIKVDYYENTPSFDYRSKKELKGTIRIVAIDGYDICACCGTQLERTGEIGLIKIISYMKYKSGSRLFMVCGFKALTDYSVKQRNVGEISALLSAKPNEVSSCVNRLYHEKENLKYQLSIARNELIDIKISSYPSGKKLVLFEAELSADEMRRYINSLVDKNSLIAIFSGNDGQGYKYMVASNKLDLSKLIKNMNQQLNGKGGGKGVAQGFIVTNRVDIENFFSNV